MKSYVTTKTGDRGETVALSGDRLPKCHALMECVGALDELRGHLARLRVRLLESERADRGDLAEKLLWLMHACFPIGAECSDPERKHPEYRRKELRQEHLDRLEAWQAQLEGRLELPQSFLAGATSALAADADLACTVARRFERRLAALAKAVPAFQPGIAIPFANRLSDALFILARTLEDGDHLPVDYDAL
jgi:cob(I)alamin adenosyltransferase